MSKTHNVIYVMLHEILQQNNCQLHLRIAQYDFDLYSKLTNSVNQACTENKGEISFLHTKWAYQITSSAVKNEEGFDLSIRFKLLKGKIQQCNAAAEFTFSNWSAGNYVLMPAAAYNGNRFESRRIAYSPKLYDPKDIGLDKAPIISDVPRLNIHDGPSAIHDRSGAMTIPSMGFYNQQFQQGFWLLTPQKTKLGDYGYSIIENRKRDKATFRISAPVVRELHKYRITDNQFPSDDKAPDWQEGDEVEIRVQLYFFLCDTTQMLFDKWNQIKHNMIPKPAPVCSFPFSSTFSIQEEKFNKQNWVEEHGYYSVGLRSMFLQDWQLGWTGGMITTYPLLFGGSTKTKERVIRNFDFLFSGGIAPSGFFYDCGETKEDGFYFYGGDIRKPYTANWHLIRKSGDGLYFILKQFWLMEKMGIEVKQAWKDGLRGVADAFVKLWKENGQLGNYVDSITGKIVVGGSTSAGIAPAGLAYAAKYYKHPDYLDTAEAIAFYFYKNYVSKGLTMGGVGDAMQNPDSESAYGILESFAVLYEQTGKKIWLQRAEEMAGQFASWIIHYNYEFPKDTTLGKLGIQTLGAVYANTQNKHGSPGICTHSGSAYLRLFRATKKTQYLDTLQSIVRFIPQMFSHPERPIPGMEVGWITERVSTTDWFEGLGELMYGSTWAETSLMLTSVEIPGIYLVPDRKLIYAMDAVEAEIEEKEGKPLTIRIKNPSKYTVNLRILIEDEAEMQKAIGENYLLDAMHVKIGPKETITKIISK